MARLAAHGSAWAGGNEWDNTQAPPAEFFRRGEALVDPATGVEYALNDAAHFDDVLWYESISDLKIVDFHEQVTVRLTHGTPGFDHASRLHRQKRQHHIDHL
ncbi:MAG: hypothetical protein R3E55_02505 [Burkholderiaceae bacterium]